jgi:dolichyl-phosphate-mannose--protein O-mannosyl transferase
MGEIRFYFFILANLCRIYIRDFLHKLFFLIWVWVSISVHTFFLHSSIANEHPSRDPNVATDESILTLLGTSRRAD